jgi:hypothetical protein
MLTKKPKEEVISIGVRNRASYLLEQYGYTMGVAKLDGNSLVNIMPAGYLDEVDQCAERVREATKNKSLAAAESKGKTGTPSANLSIARLPDAFQYTNQLLIPKPTYYRYCHAADSYLNRRSGSHPRGERDKPSRASDFAGFAADAAGKKAGPPFPFYLVQNAFLITALSTMQFIQDDDSFLNLLSQRSPAIMIGG